MDHDALRGLPHAVPNGAATVRALSRLVSSTAATARLARAAERVTRPLRQQSAAAERTMREVPGGARRHAHVAATITRAHRATAMITAPVRSVTTRTAKTARATVQAMRGRASAASVARVVSNARARLAALLAVAAASIVHGVRAGCTRLADYWFARRARRAPRTIAPAPGRAATTRRNGPAVVTVRLTITAPNAPPAVAAPVTV